MAELTPEFRMDQVRRYVEALFDPADRVAVALIHPLPGPRIVQYFVERRRLLDAAWLADLASYNEMGYGAHVAPNPLVPGAGRRSKATTLRVSSVWIDMDGMGADLPDAATITVQTSEGRRHVMWRLPEPVGVADGERMLRALARAFGADRGATDACRLLRLPGFVNTKYPAAAGAAAPIVRIVGGTGLPANAPIVGDAERVVDLPPVRAVGITTGGAASAPPPEIAGDEDLVRLWSGRRRAAWDADKSASERDFALAIALHRLGVPFDRAAEIIVSSPNRAGGRVKPDLGYYVALTLRNAGYAAA